jgi:hypothetical protein
MRGTDDRLWCIAELNAMRHRRWPWPGPRSAPLAAGTSWSVLRDRLSRPRLSLRTPDDFDEADYLRCNPDVESAVRAGDVASGYLHFLLHGRKEGRPRATRD